VPRLAAIVPATDGRVTLVHCREAIDTAAQTPEEVVVVRSPAGAGPAAARNAGALQADADVLVFVDADVAVRPDAFQRIRAAFEADPSLTAVFGSYDDQPAPGAGTVALFRNLLHHHVHSTSAGEADTFWAGLGAIRRDAFLAAGGFDTERYPHASFEDVDLGMRLARQGARIVLDPEVTCTHLKTWDLHGMVRTDLVKRGVPWVSLLLRHRTVPTRLNLGWRHRLSAAASLVMLGLGLGRRPRGFLAALGALLMLNARFYSLLVRRLGPARAGAGVGLHVLHHLTGVAAIPAGVVRHLVDGAQPPLGRSVVERGPEVQAGERAVGAPGLGDPLELLRPGQLG
jgi:glycosyltransferase involved in cell wall biosynthesis